MPIERADPPRFVGIGADAHDAPAGTTVAFTAPVEPGTFVRDVGTDIAQGDVLLRAGTRLGPAQLGSLAAAGVVDVPVRPRARVLVLSTGHELRDPGVAFDPDPDSGAIYDANSTMLAAAVAEAGAVAVTDAAPDDAAAVVAVLEAHPEADLVVTTGGVSAGAFEVVREALAPLGVDFGPVAMQPGGPQGLGMPRCRAAERCRSSHSRGTLCRPLYRSSSSCGRCCAASPGWPRSGRRSSPCWRIPCRLPRRGTRCAAAAFARTARSRSERRARHLLHAYALANVLVHLPVGVESLPAGAEVEIWRIDDGIA